ncbi:MAG: NDP-hexose 2,3-dehydratase family protein [Nitrospirae bacterium]|nr:NDP-hexose 2,3-dehydratase family protein [Nitrospirota bacterium]
MPDMKKVSEAGTVREAASAPVRYGGPEGRADSASLESPITRGSFGPPAGPESLPDVLLWLDNEKARNHIYQKRQGLKTLAGWKVDGEGFLSHKEGRFFRVMGLSVTCLGREVASWHQPIIENISPGIIGLLVKKCRGRTFVLMQAKADAGNRSAVQLGPTVQFTQENYVENEQIKKPFLFDEFVTGKGLVPLHESRQSEEGGRFFREAHIHRIMMLPEGSALDIPAEFRWMTLEQIRFFLHMGEYVNFCARSILACMC